MTLRVSAILLAAGRSSRMGRPKQLLPLGGKPVILHCLGAIAEAGIENVVVVLNPLVSDAVEAIHHLRLSIVFNNDQASEMAESVRIGLITVNPSSSGVLIYLSDYPLVSADTVKSLISRHWKEPDKILVPSYNGKKGHPCLFPVQFAREVFQGATLKEVVHRDGNRILLVPVQDQGILFDMDTEKDYNAVIRLHSQKGTRTLAT